MGKMAKASFSDQFMLERSRLYAKYGEKLPRRTDTIELQMDYPDCGWIDMHFKVNGEEKVMISASDVYEPFLNAFKDGELERDDNNVHFLHVNGVKKPVP